MLCSDISHPGSPPPHLHRAPPLPYCGVLSILENKSLHFFYSQAGVPAQIPPPPPALLVFLISLLESHDSNRVLQVCTVRLTGSPPKAPLPILVLWVLPPNPAHAGRHHFPSLGDPCCMCGWFHK